MDSFERELSSFQFSNHSNLVIKLSIAILELVDPDLNQQLVREEELHKEPTSPPGWHIHQHLKGTFDAQTSFVSTACDQSVVRRSFELALLQALQAC